MLTAEVAVIGRTVTAGRLQKIDELEAVAKVYKDEIDVLKGKLEAVAPLELVEKLEEQTKYCVT